MICTQLPGETLQINVGQEAVGTALKYSKEKEIGRSLSLCFLRKF